MAEAKISLKPRLHKLGDQLTAEQLRALVHYDPLTGVFTWKRREEIDHFVSTWNKKWAGKRAGTKGDQGYLTFGVYNQRYLCHRLAWLYMTDAWPSHVIDHINMKRDDNRFANLRAITQAQNLYNSTIRSNNTSGYMGVKRHVSGLWHARIMHNGRDISLGYFHSPELAGAAYRGAERALRGKWRVGESDVYDATAKLLG